MRVLGPRVLVKRIDSPALKSSIIEIVEFEPEPSSYALVLGVGQQYYKDNTKHPIDDINEMDVVLLKKYSGSPIQYKGEECFFVQYEDVMAIVKI